jgi:hypothetical protein
MSKTIVTVTIDGEKREVTPADNRLSKILGVWARIYDRDTGLAIIKPASLDKAQTHGVTPLIMVNHKGREGKVFSEEGMLIVNIPQTIWLNVDKPVTRAPGATASVAISYSETYATSLVTVVVHNKQEVFVYAEHDLKFVVRTSRRGDLRPTTYEAWAAGQSNPSGQKYVRDMDRQMFELRLPNGDVRVTLKLQDIVVWAHRYCEANAPADTDTASE